MDEADHLRMVAITDECRERIAKISGNRNLNIVAVGHYPNPDGGDDVEATTMCVVSSGCRCPHCCLAVGKIAIGLAQDAILAVLGIGGEGEEEGEESHRAFVMAMAQQWFLAQLSNRHNFIDQTTTFKKEYKHDEILAPTDTTESIEDLINLLLGGGDKI